MLEYLQQHLLAFGDFAPLAFFFLLVIAGFNIPISSDVVVLAAATTSARLMPEKKMIFFIAIFTGCLVSAWCAHFLGKWLGSKLLRLRLFSSLLKEDRVAKIQSFYDKHALLTLMVGRFIPFGVRNAIFMTTGLSKMPFKKFALRDSLACLLWCSTSYFLFFKLAENIDVLKTYIKKFNIGIFILFTLAVITIVWYKLRKKRAHSSTYETKKEL